MADQKFAESTYIEDEKGVFGGHDLGRTVAGDLGSLFIPPHVSTRSKGNFVSGALEKKDMLDDRTVLQGGIDDGLGGDGLATSTALVCGDHNARTAVIYAIA
jgi:hypothetical protein